MDRTTFYDLALTRLRAAHPAHTFTLDAERGQIVAKTPEDLTQLIRLENYYRELEAAAPAEREKLVERFVRSAIAVDSEETLDEVRVLLVPRIRPRRYFTHDLPAQAASLARASGATADPKPLHHTAFAEHLGVALAIDRPERIEYVADPARFGVPVAELDEIALANLRRMTKTKLTELRPGIYEGAWDDEYAAERMLLPELWEGLAVEGDPVVFLPGAERIFVAGSEDARALDLAKGFADERLGAPRPLLDIAFVRREGAWSVFEGGTADADLGGRLSRLLADVYAKQRLELDAQQDEDGDEGAPYIASVMGIATEGGELVKTLTTFTDGVRAWLPRTDAVVLQRMETGEMFPVAWNELFALAPGCLRPVPDLYPPRWETTEFPDEATFARLKALAKPVEGLPSKEASTPARHDAEADAEAARAKRKALAARSRPSVPPEPDTGTSWKILRVAIALAVIAFAWFLRR